MLYCWVPVNFTGDYSIQLKTEHSVNAPGVLVCANLVKMGPVVGTSKVSHK